MGHEQREKLFSIQKVFHAKYILVTVITEIPTLDLYTRVTMNVLRPWLYLPYKLLRACVLVGLFSFPVSQFHVPILEAHMFHSMQRTYSYP